MPHSQHILLTRRDPALTDAVHTVLPEAQIHDLARPVPADAEGQAWCFVDWLLDDRSGLEVCRWLRSAPGTRASHITLVLDDDAAASRARALAAGADDYMPGPLTAGALAERLRLYLGSPPAHSHLGQSVLTLDHEAHVARWQGRAIPLRPGELRLLEVFLANPDRLLSRPKIISLLGKTAEIGDDRTVDVWVGRLRRTLDNHGVSSVLRTVRSLGYVFDTA